ncbi:GNAT family N-acetyltransferase [Candidatus Micrarchaeota archaeon]|nr:GNAT family N-acetyltransferase [Candidatus Micrarchaeota archaeon]
MAEDNRKAVGFCEFGPFSLAPVYKDQKTIMVWCLYVVPGYRNKGIGKRLLKEVDTVRKLAKLKTMRIDAHVDNAGAISLYSSLGFKKHMMQMVRCWR